MRLRFSTLVFFFILIGLLACKKKGDDWTNPFDDPSLLPPPDTSGQVTLNPVSIEGLHKNIFFPTCANSGCHDGTFEPDFRTMEGTYHTLVFHSIVKNDPVNPYDYRVLPGDADHSLIIARLVYDIDGQSGIMPLVTDPGSDWPQKKLAYIQNIRDWINAGAKDMFGNFPTLGNYQPMITGIIGFANGSLSPASRKPGKGPIKLNVGTNLLDIYFAISDAETPPLNLTYNKVRFSTSLNDFSNAVELDLLPATSFTGTGFAGDTVTFTHKVSVNPSSWPVNAAVFVRTYVQDGNPSVTEIPNYGSEDYIKKYSAFITE